MKKRFLATIAVSALLMGTLLTSCESQEVIKEVKYYGVSTSSTGKGTLVASTTSALEGSDVTFVLTPEEGFKVSSFKVNGEEKVTTLNNNQLVVQMTNQGLKAEAVFAEATFKVNLDVKEGGQAKLSKLEGLEGDEIELEVIPDGGYAVNYVEIDGEDKTLDLVNGKLTFTLGTKDTNIEVYFEEITDFGVEISHLKNSLSAHTNQDFEASTIKDVTSSGISLIEKTLKKYSSTEEGVYSVFEQTNKNSSTSKITNKTRKKTILEADNKTVYSLNQSYNLTTGEISDSSISRLVDSEDGSKYVHRIVSGASSLNLYINKVKIFTDEVYTNIESDIKYEKNKTSFVYKAHKATASLWDVEEYIENEVTFEFDDNNRITKAHYSEVKYHKDSFTFDAASKKVTLNADATPYSKAIGDLTYEFNTFGTEPSENKTPLVKNLLLTDFELECKENEVLIEPDANGDYKNLTVGHSYTFKATNILPVDANYGEPLSVEVVDGGDLVEAYYNSYEDAITLHPLDEFQMLEVNVKSYNVTKSFIISAQREKLTNLTLICETDTLAQSGELLLSVAGNDVSCDTSCAFVFEGDSLGCKVVESDEGYKFVAGEVEGQVTFYAVSITDSTIVSNKITLTIGNSFAVDTFLGGKTFAQTNHPQSSGFPKFTSSISFDFVFPMGESYMASWYSMEFPEDGGTCNVNFVEGAYVIDFGEFLLPIKIDDKTNYYVKKLKIMDYIPYVSNGETLMTTGLALEEYYETIEAIEAKQCYTYLVDTSLML